MKWPFQHEINICDNRDLPWMNNRVEDIINEKGNTLQCYIHSNKGPRLFNKVEIKPLIEGNKEKYC